MKKEPFLKNFPNYLQLISFLIIIIISWFLINILGILIALPFWGTKITSIMMEGIKPGVDANINFFKFIQIVNHVGMFLVPSIIFAFLVRGNIAKYFKINIQPKIFTLVISTLLIIVCLPFINWLMTINGMMKLPDFLSGLEEWMRKTEDSASLITDQFLNVKSIGGLFSNLLVIAIIPALGEEFFFRGVLQKQFNEWFKNIHVAIIVSAFLFSAMHVQFFGFIPRFALGLLLGYLFYFSRNLWVPITVHFFNNGIAVVAYYLNNNKIITTDVDKLGSSGNDYILIVGSVVFTIILMMSIYKREHYRKRGLQEKNL